jgi:hypothetical protein
MLKDGTQTLTANIPMSAFKLTGLGAGSTNGDSVRYEQSPAGLFAAKGDLISASAANAPSILTVGANGKSLLADSSQTTGLLYALSGAQTLGTIAGTNTITAVAAPIPAAYAAGQSWYFIPAATNTGATTLNISGKGARNVFNAGASCIGGELTINVPSLVYDDGTQLNIVPFVQASGTTASTFTFNGGGSPGSTGSLTMSWTKLANTVTLYIPVAQATSGTSSTTLTSNTALPASIRPTTAQQYVSTTSFNNGGTNSAPGVVSISTGGIVQFLQNAAALAYTNATTCGTASAMTITYTLGL